jgi:hypothetical protein
MEIPTRTGPICLPSEAARRRCKPMLAAIGNAIYDATAFGYAGFHFRNARVLAALKDARV